VPRPKYIADLHAAFYDLLFCSRQEERALLEKYRSALQHASATARMSEEMMKAVVARDFSAWVKEEKLPKPPRRN
jgi:hypothetical protein